MRLSIVNDRISQALLRFLVRKLPVELKDWGEAMRAELDTIQDAKARLCWTIGSLWALIKEVIAQGVTKAVNARPRSVTLIALYYSAFCCELVAVLSWQMIGHKIHGSWQEAAFPLAFCFLLALLPGVIATGLWLLDDAARIMAIMFALAHALLNWAWMSQPLVGYRLLTSTRIGLDILAILLLTRPAVKRIFHQQRIELHLRA
jgi:hypothetical protein